MNYAAIIREIRAEQSCPSQRMDADDYCYLECSLPRRVVDIGDPAHLDKGTVFCPWCPDRECNTAETPARAAAFDSYIAGLRQRNERATREARRYGRRRTEGCERMEMQRVG